MAETLLANAFQTTLANTPQIVFTADPAKDGTLMSAITVANDTATNGTWVAYIGPTTPTPTKAIVPKRSIDKKKTDVPPELSGHTVLAGQALWFETDQPLATSITVTGRALT